MKRTDQIRYPYELAHTRLIFPDGVQTWEVTTIDLKRINQQMKGDKPNPLLASIAASLEGKKTPQYATMIYQKNSPIKSAGPMVSEDSEAALPPPTPPASTGEQILQNKKVNKLFFHQAYDTTEEADFGHEELVQSILNFQFFYFGRMMFEDNVPDYLLYPEVGEPCEGEPFHFLPYGLFDLNETDEWDLDDLESEDDGDPGS